MIQMTSRCTLQLDELAQPAGFGLRAALDLTGQCEILVSHLFNARFAAQMEPGAGFGLEVLRPSPAQAGNRLRRASSALQHRNVV